MAKLSRNLAAISLTAIMSACTAGNNDTLTDAEDAFAAGRFAAAQATCDSLILGDSFAALSVSELCRLAVLTAKLSDHSNEQETMALATRCMRAALDRDADSVLQFARELPVDEQTLTLMLRQLTRQISEPTDSFEIPEFAEPLDTIITE